MSELLERLKGKYQNLARRWELRTNDNEKAVLTARDIDFILAVLVKTTCAHGQIQS